MSLSNAQNVHYKQHSADWQLARAFYSADDVDRYLRRGKYEQEAAFESRKAQAHLFPYTRQIIHQLSDQLLLRVDEVERSLGPVPQSYMDAAGPDGESHNMQMKTLGDYLLLYGEAWLQVVPTGLGAATLRVLSPLTVPRWQDEKVLTLGQASKPGVAIDEPEETDTTYTIHSPRGYVTYMEEQRGGETERIQIDSGVYAPDDFDAFFVTEDGRPTAPLIRVQMPWDAVLGVELSKTHLQMYRLENQLDGRLRTALTSGQLVYNGLNESGEEKVIISHKQGSNLFFLPDGADVKPMKVPTEAVAMAEKRLESKEDTLYETAYQTLREATSNASATEAVVRNQATAAAVATLASTIQSAETAALNLVAQSVDLVSYGGPDPAAAGIESDWTSINWADASVNLSA
jgi:hypothetical protein